VKVKKIFKTALCGAIENGSFQSHHKKAGTAERVGLGGL